MSGIYIPGMGVPTNEPLLVKINPDGSVSTTARNGYKKYTAVPVPEHGDLIDRDETAKTLAHDYAYAAADIVRNEMPTIIPADKEGEG